MLPNNIASALSDIATRLNEAGVDYCIGGSAMLALNGFDVSVGDIDMVVHPSARDLMESLLPSTREGESFEPWKSVWLLTGEYNNDDGTTGVDVIGGLSLMIDGIVASFPCNGSQTADVRGAPVVLASLAQWYHLYRVHAPHKAEMIAGRLSDEEIMTAAVDLGIDQAFSPTLIVRIGNESQEDTIEETMNAEQQSSIIEVASPTDLTFDEPGTEIIDLEKLGETLEYIRPALQADGGDLVLLGTEAGKVTLQMVGACGGCPLSTMTLTAGIERILKDRVPGVTEVVSI